ncbi:MAG TPA: hypothetical protein VF648_13685 [Pyrinomonadaceae bacterium]|jgi:hypothetical protein
MKQLILLLIFLTLFSSMRQEGQAQRTYFKQEMSEELINLRQTKWQEIGAEVGKFSDNEWVGLYVAQNGTTVSTQLVWTPNLGFMIWLENCSRPFHGLINYGDASLTDGSLKLTPRLPEGSPNSYTIKFKYIPVKWGEQHFLIPSHEMIKFVYVVNSKSDAEINSFLIKGDDYEKKRRGMPGVPEEYKKYLGMKPITATISKLEEQKDWYPKITFNAGRAEGVIEGMSFYLSRPRNMYALVYVADVQEHTSEGYISIASYTDNREGEIKPAIGWKFSSRAPEDNSNYLP